MWFKRCRGIASDASGNADAFHYLRAGYNDPRTGNPYGIAHCYAGGNFQASYTDSDKNGGQADRNQSASNAAAWDEWTIANSRPCLHGERSNISFPRKWRTTRHKIRWDGWQRT